MNALFVFTVSCLATAVLSSILGIFVLIKARNRELNNAFFLFYFNVMIWSLGLGLEVNSLTREAGLFWSRFLHVGVIFLAPSYLYFILVYVNKIRTKRLLLLGTYGVALLLFFANFTRLIVYDVSPKFYFRYYTDPGIMYPCVLILFCWCVGYAFYELSIDYKRSLAARRNQIKYFFVSAIVGYVIGSGTYLPVFNISVPPLSMFFVFLHPLAVTYAMQRYHLLDIRVVLGRVIIFCCVYVPFLLLPFFITFQWKTILIGTFGDYYWTIPTLFEGIFVIVGLFFYRIVQSKTEYGLLQEEYQHRQAIQDLSKDLVRFDDIKKLAQLVVDRCRKRAGIESMGVYVWLERTNSYQLIYQEGIENEQLEKDIQSNHILIGLLKQKQNYVGYEEISDEPKRKIMDSYPWAIAIPAFHRDELLGILVLGDKKNSQVYTPVEFWAFNVLANQIAATIIAIKTFEEKSRIERELLEVQRMIEIGRLACGMGHQINNNVGVMSSASQMLQMDNEIRGLLAPKPDVLARYDEAVGELISQACDCRRIIDEVSLYGKSEPAAKEDTDVDLCEVFRQALRFAQLRTPRFKHIDIEIVLPKTPAMVLGSRLQLQQVMINVINNSFDAIIMEEHARNDLSYKGWMKVTLTEEPGFYHMHFMDNGIGMNERTQESIFKVPMYTTKGSAQKRQARQEAEGKKDEITGGTGIGAYMVYVMVHGHGGDIKVYHSEYRKGTDILLVLPKKRDFTVV